MKYLLGLFLVIASSGVYAERCPADDMGCDSSNWSEKVSDRVDQGREEVSEADSMRERVDAVKSTLNDCADCAMKVINDSIDGGGNATPQ